MQRIHLIEEAKADEKTRTLLSAVKAQMGGVPNILATMAHSAAALEGYLNFSGALNTGVLSPKLREQVAVTVAGANSCDYCASVHTALGGKHGLSKDELSANLRGESQDPKTAAALRFVDSIVSKCGHLDDADYAAVSGAGFSIEEVIELIAHTALNIFTNYFNHIAETEIDFPLVDTSSVKA